MPAPGPPTAAPTRAPVGLERHPQAEPDQSGVLPVEEAETVLRGRNRKPDGRPDPGAILEAGPLLRGDRALEAAPTLAVHCLGEEALLLAEPQQDKEEGETEGMDVQLPHENIVRKR